MKASTLILYAITALGLFSCSDKNAKTKLNAERQARHNDLYRVPPPSDPVEDDWTKVPPKTPQTVKNQ